MRSQAARLTGVASPDRGRPDEPPKTPGTLGAAAPTRRTLVELTLPLPVSVTGGARNEAQQ